MKKKRVFGQCDAAELAGRVGERHSFVEETLNVDVVKARALDLPQPDAGRDCCIDQLVSRLFAADFDDGSHVLELFGRRLFTIEHHDFVFTIDGSYEIVESRLQNTRLMDVKNFHFSCPFDWNASIPARTALVSRR